MTKTKIEWADATWNPVWGCLAGCEYCYARDIARRFAEYIANNQPVENINKPQLALKLKRFEPTFLWSHFRNFKPPTKPSRIFIGSMSDIAYWRSEWIGLVANVIRQYPQHTFLLLTKFPKVYKNLEKTMPANVWFGVSVTKNAELDKLIEMNRHIGYRRVRFVSFEPVMEYIRTGNIFGAGLVDWIIAGAMSGRHKPRTKTEWIGAIVANAKDFNIPVFVKQIEQNGKIIKDMEQFPEALRYREFPSPEFINHLKQQP